MLSIRPHNLSRCCCNHGDISKIGVKLIAAGSPVIINSDTESDNRFIGVLWPSTAVPAGELHIPAAVCRSEQLCYGSKVHIAPLRCPVRYASRISMYIDHNLAAGEGMVSLQAFLHNLLIADIRFVRGGQTIEFDYLGQPLTATVEDIKWPEDRYCRLYFPITGGGENDEMNHIRKSYAAVDFDTQILLVSATLSKKKPVEKSIEDIEYSAAVGGLSREIRKVRETVEGPLRTPEIYRRFGMRPPRGILLYGPPGTGKTLIARTVAKATGAHCVVINGAEITSKFYGETEGRVSDICYYLQIVILILHPHFS
jgi:AAA family ATPase